MFQNISSIKMTVQLIISICRLAKLSQKKKRQLLYQSFCLIFAVLIYNGTIQSDGGLDFFFTKTPLIIYVPGSPGLPSSDCHDAYHSFL